MARLFSRFNVTNAVYMALSRLRDSSTAAAVMVLSMMLAVTWVAVAAHLLHQYHFPPPLLRHQSYNKAVQDVLNRLRSEHLQNKSHTRFPFRYTINERGLCQDNVAIINMVPVHPHQTEVRHFIRSTWAKPTLFRMSRMKTAFLMGSTAMANMTLEVARESDTFHDIIQLDFEHPADDLSHTTLSMLHWTLTYCPRAKWILRTRANVVVNTLAMSDFLLGTNEDFACLMAEEGVPCRTGHCEGGGGGNGDPSTQQSPPPHCAPHAYALNTDIARDLYLFANKTHQHPDENVLFTGTLPQPLQPTYHRLRSKQLQFGKTAIYKEGWSNLPLMTVGKIRGRAA
ncbi:beta-1,3-galactosyltransferase 1-like [Penaeus monodon]|uniref:beta-1,3-galactosyltransferase 1-like n=1 Tax=Penaeus monodon TaxID=6687 RepID=UPI0018A6E123|nr:beta-1,3-galactosyltransferase 1-like [Penaeus monodon]